MHQITTRELDSWLVLFLLSLSSRLHNLRFLVVTPPFHLIKKAKATLGSGDLRLAVQLPAREDLNEWLAVNTVDFFNQINLLYGRYAVVEEQEEKKTAKTWVTHPNQPKSNPASPSSVHPSRAR